MEKYDIKHVEKGQDPVGCPSVGRPSVLLDRILGGG